MVDIEIVAGKLGNGFLDVDGSGILGQYAKEKEGCKIGVSAGRIMECSKRDSEEFDSAFTRTVTHEVLHHTIMGIVDQDKIDLSPLTLTRNEYIVRRILGQNRSAFDMITYIQMDAIEMAIPEIIKKVNGVSFSKYKEDVLNGTRLRMIGIGMVMFALGVLVGTIQWN